MGEYFMHVSVATGTIGGILTSAAFVLSVGSLWFTFKALSIGLRNGGRQRRRQDL